MNSRAVFGIIKKIQVYVIAVLLLSWLSQQFNILPNSVGLWFFHLGLWCSLVLCIGLLPYTLIRFVRADSFDRWAYLGFLSAIPAVVVWLWIGPANFTTPSIRDIATDHSISLASNQYPTAYDRQVQRAFYPRVQPWVTYSSKERIWRQIAQLADDHDWKLLTSDDNQWLYEVESSGLAIRYLLVVRQSERSYGTRIDARMLSRSGERDYGFMNQTIELLRDSFNKR